MTTTWHSNGQELESKDLNQSVDQLHLKQRSAAVPSADRFLQAVQFAIGRTFAAGSEFVELSADERGAIVRLIAAHQLVMFQRGKVSRRHPLDIRKELRAEKRRLDAQIKALLGEERFACFGRFWGQLGGGLDF